MGGNKVVIDFWEARERRQAGQHGPVAKHALDKCEETFMRGEWKMFGFWHAVFTRERARSQFMAQDRGSRS